MLVAVGTAGMAPPEAVLTELVIVTLLAAVAKPHHALAVAVGTLDGVEDCAGERNGEPKTKTKKHLEKIYGQTPN